MLVLHGLRRVVLAEDVEIGQADHFLGGAARGGRRQPAGTDKEEPAVQVLEVHALICVGQ